MGDKFFQSDSGKSVGYWACIGSLSDYIFILTVGCWSQRELGSLSFGSGCALRNLRLHSF